jgi:membrane protease YdiL (CAAX protease family)
MPIAAVVLLTVVPAVCEEIASRGLVTLGLVRRLGAPLAVLISAALFAALHMSLVRALPTGLLGAALAIMAIRSRSVFPSMLAHALNNAIALLVGSGRLDGLGDALERWPDPALAVAAVLSGGGLALLWTGRDRT